MQPETSLLTKIIRSRLIIFLFASFIWCTADYLLEFNFPPYLEGINKSYIEIGLLLSLGSVGGLIIDLPLGDLSDKISRKKLIILGIGLLIVSSVLIFYFTSDLLLAMAFLLWSVAYELWRVPRDAYFASITNKLKRSQEYGLDLEVTYLGQTLGPLIGGFVVTNLGYPGIVGFYSFFLIIVMLILIVFIKETNHKHISHAVYSSANIQTIKTEWKELKTLGVIGLFLLFFTLMLTSWEQILLTLGPLFYGPDVLNISPELGGIFLSCFSLPGILLAYPTGKLADKFGKGVVLATGLIIMGSSLMLFSAANNIYFAFSFALLVGIGWVTSLPALNGFLIDLTYKHKKGKICGIWNFFRNVGFILGPIIGGLVAEAVGLKNTFLIFGSLVVLSIIAFLALTKGKMLKLEH